MALAEGEVGTGTGSIDYSAVTSCMTVTCLLDDGSTVGGHLSLKRVSGKLNSSEVVPQMKDLIGTKTIVSVVLAGADGIWTPAYLTTPLYADDGSNNYGDNQPSPDSMWSKIGELLGLDGTENMVLETREGSFTITPAPPS